jgi:hypothetical protein
MSTKTLLLLTAFLWSPISLSLGNEETKLAVPDVNNVRELTELLSMVSEKRLEILYQEQDEHYLTCVLLRPPRGLVVAQYPCSKETNTSIWDALPYWKSRFYADKGFTQRLEMPASKDQLKEFKTRIYTASANSTGVTMMTWNPAIVFDVPDTLQSFGLFIPAAAADKENKVKQIWVSMPNKN